MCYILEKKHERLDNIEIFCTLNLKRYGLNLSLILQWRDLAQWEMVYVEQNLQVMSKQERFDRWILRATEDYLTPIYDRLHAELLKREVLHADETTLQVLHEPGKEP